MAGTRKPRVPMVEQIRLINKCRQSGMGQPVSENSSGSDPSGELWSS